MLFVGIRNRYCSVCERANNKNIEVPIHKCFLNWKKASTAMEADGIIEGFINSMSMHGLKYNKLIGKLNYIFHFLNYTYKFYFSGDGDSSVTKRLNEVMPYGPDFKIKKVECRNHLLRNYIMKLSALTKKTEYPIIIRKFIINNILRFRSDIMKAVKYHLSTNLTLQQKTAGED